MYQFFVNENIEPGKKIILSKEQSHHAVNVLRLHNEKVRIVSQNKAFFGNGFSEKKNFSVEILEEDKSEKELLQPVTLMIALIRKEKMEFALQKCTELGVTRIVPFLSSRTVVHLDEKRMDKVLSRWESILEEASAQCKRNIIPELTGVVQIEDLKNYKENQNFIAYENASFSADKFGDNLAKEATSFVIGPEGGFSEEEANLLISEGFHMVSFGNRILRAETAAIYGMSILSNYLEKQNEF